MNELEMMIQAFRDAKSEIDVVKVALDAFIESINVDSYNADVSELDKLVAEKPGFSSLKRLTAIYALNQSITKAKSRPYVRD